MPTVTFQVIEGVDKGRIFRDLPIPVTIGREEGNLLRLNDERVSRFHAKVQQEDGDIILTDLESTNGTRVNGSPVQIRRLRAGDQISVGRSMLLFGTLEEIAARRTAERPATKAAGAPEGATIPGTVPGDDLAFEVHTVEAASGFFHRQGSLMPANSFAHLHCHTHYSLLDGANRIPELVAQTKKLGMTACAITDHGNLYG